MAISKTRLTSSGIPFRWRAGTKPEQGRANNIVDSARLRVAHHAGSFAFPAS
ncbi:hypothetical protein BURMUCGD1_1574 [Burkholderia multivorans CGD1]|nr:hypothetical protein BURMUCGD1_1574 [Burkholderia multivorans CGD1]